MQTTLFSSGISMLPNSPSDFCVQMLDVLSPRDHQKLLEYVAASEARFTDTTTTTGAINYRKSTVLYQFSEHHLKIENVLRPFLPHACEILGLPSLHGKIEAQLTAHNDRQYYKVHNDNGSEVTKHRVLTYVYYFNRTPKGFQDGKLRIYDRKDLNGDFLDIEPIDNSMVIFRSEAMHEVLPVNCPSRLFMDSRFTINGWVAAE